MKNFSGVGSHGWQVDRFTGESEDRRRVNLPSPTHSSHLTIMVMIMIIIIMIMVKRLKMSITTTTMIVLRQWEGLSQNCVIFPPSLWEQSLKMSLLCLRAFLLLFLVVGAQSAPKSQREGSLQITRVSTGICLWPVLWNPSLNVWIWQTSVWNGLLHRCV